MLGSQNQSKVLSDIIVSQSVSDQCTVDQSAWGRMWGSESICRRFFGLILFVILFAFFEILKSCGT